MEEKREKREKKKRGRGGRKESMCEIMSTRTIETRKKRRMSEKKRDITEEMFSPREMI